MSEGRIEVEHDLFLIPDQWAISAILAAVIVAILLFFVWTRLLTRSKDGERSSTYLFGVFISTCAATFILLAPIAYAIQGGNPITTFPLVLVRLLQAISIDNGFVDFIHGTPVGTWAIIYYTLLGIMYVALPVLAALNIFDIVRQYAARLSVFRVARYKATNKNVFLFSDFNANTFGLAQDVLDADGAAFVVFGSMSKAERDTWSTEIKELGDVRAKFLELDYTNLAVRLCDQFKFKELRCFALSEDNEKNVAETCQAISRLRGERSGVGKSCQALLPNNGSIGKRKWGKKSPEDRAAMLHFYVAYDSADDELVIDAANSNIDHGAPKLPVTMLKEATMAAYALFDDAPLFEILGPQETDSNGLRPSTNQTLDVLIVGSGAVAEEVTKVALWCGQMHNVTLNVRIACDQGSDIEDRMRLRCPELFPGEGKNDVERFKLEITKLNIRSPQFDEMLLGEYGESTHLYIVVAIEDDALAHEIAMHARLFFLDLKLSVFRETVSTHPFIACLIREESMSTLINKQFDENIPGYGIHPFGSARTLFSYRNIIDSGLERAGQLADAVYGYLYDEIDEKINMSFGVKDDVIDVDAFSDEIAKHLESYDIYGKLIEIGMGSIASKNQILHYSNLSLAMHTKYKAWALGESIHSARTEQQRLSTIAIKTLGEIEHDRWVVYYQTQGYASLSESEQERFSRLLPGDNCRRKIEPLKKHTAICACEHIWTNYLHAQSGFEYEEASDSPTGESTIEICRTFLPKGPDNGLRPEAVNLQLLDSKYHVIEAWTMERDSHLTKPLADGVFIVHPTSAISGLACANDVRFEIRGGKVIWGGTDKRVPINCAGSPLVNPVVYDWAFVCATPYMKDLLDMNNIATRSLFQKDGAVYKKRAGLRKFNLICVKGDAYSAYNRFEDVLYHGSGYYVEGREKEYWKPPSLSDIAKAYVVDGSKCAFAEDGEELTEDLIARAKRFAMQIKDTPHFTTENFAKHRGGKEDEIKEPNTVTIPIRYRDSYDAPVFALKAPRTIKTIWLERPTPYAMQLSVNGERDRFDKHISHSKGLRKNQGDMLVCPMFELKDTRQHRGDPILLYNGRKYYADLSEMYVINGIVFKQTYESVNAIRLSRFSSRTACDKQDATLQPEPHS